MIKIYKDIRNIPIDEVRPYWNNPRINDATRHALVDAFKKIGFNQPILVDKDKVIVKGHARYYAARMSGYLRIPCIVSEATDEKNRADRLLDNKIAELTEWNPATLEEELSKITLRIEGVDIDLGKQLAGLDQAAGDPSTIAPLPKKTLRVGCPACGTPLKFDVEELLSRPNVEDQDEAKIEGEEKGGGDELR